MQLRLYEKLPPSEELIDRYKEEQVRGKQRVVVGLALVIGAAFFVTLMPPATYVTFLTLIVFLGLGISLLLQPYDSNFWRGEKKDIT